MKVQVEMSRDYSGFDRENENAKVFLDLSSILRKRIFVIFCFLLCAVCLPILLYLESFDESKLPPKVEGVCLLDSSYRTSCGNVNISETNCSRILCCFEKKTNSCYHQEPSMYFYYQEYEKDLFQFIPSLQYTPIGLPSVKDVKMNYFEDEMSLRVYINDTRRLMRGVKEGFKNFDILSNDNKKLSITVYRKNTTEMLLTTLKGPLIINKDYLEWTIQLTNNSGVLFGLGQLKIDSNENSTVTKIIYKNQDDHHTSPMFMAYNNGKYHAVIIRHEGALQVTVLPSYLIHLKAVYTDGVEIQIIDGPTPRDIYEKLREKNKKPEWIYGLHICREEPAKTMDDLKHQYTSFVSNKNEYPKFEYESDCIHDDFLLHLLAENYTSNMTRDLFNSLQLSNNFILSFPPQIPLYSQLFQKYRNKTIFYMNGTDGSLYVGKYKNFDVVYPVYSQKNTEELVEEIVELFPDIKISGLTLTNSWPQDDNYKTGDMTAPFMNKDIAHSFLYTIPWNMPEGEDIHADIHARYHNEYGSTFSGVLEKKLKTQIIFSPVSSYNLNHFSIFQNVNTTWTDLRKSLTITLFNSMFGRNFQAMPICGSNSYDKKLQEDLCLRWYLLGATMPLIRISSKGLQRSPINLFNKYTVNKVIDILDTRRSFIPYYRKIIEDDGSPLVRPMFFNFPKDENVLSLDEQYMLGDAILVAQPMSIDIEIMQIYLPPEKVWFEIWGGQRYQTKKGDEWIKFSIVKNDWVSFVLEGHIIPIVKKTSTGPEITLIIAMKSNTSDCQAIGSILCEDLGDEVINFCASGKNITITPPTVKHMNVEDFIKTICTYGFESSKCEPPNHEFIN